MLKMADLDDREDTDVRASAQFNIGRAFFQGQLHFYMSMKDIAKSLHLEDVSMSLSLCCNGRVWYPAE